MIVSSLLRGSYASSSVPIKMMELRVTVYTTPPIAQSIVAALHYSPRVNFKRPCDIQIGS
jgi:hypothetical protein